ncbi:hypothetical protein U9M48_017881 [Paspalum notatum var. saurae]|uniref:UDP N-acetylglucosamine O-acyltransferase C-terminal domain-containing protein n=2 Tax=Paspalum notatum var. saurae TaxID=547442 RepID=A0AAQ3TB90_PASNO
MAAAAAAARRLLSSRLQTTTTRLLHATAGASQGAARETSGGFIHPAAVVHPDAVIGQGVLIGPFCTVGPSARIGDACQLHGGSHVMGDTELGEGCVVQTGAILGADIPGQTIIGENNVIGHYAVVGVKCQDLKYKTLINPGCPSAPCQNSTKMREGGLEEEEEEEEEGKDQGGEVDITGGSGVDLMNLFSVPHQLQQGRWKREAAMVDPGKGKGKGKEKEKRRGREDCFNDKASSRLTLGTGEECFLHIGRNNEIREYCSIHRSSKSCDCTVIGDNNLIMGSCHVAHDCKIGSNNIFANNTLFAGHVVVEDSTHTAGAVVVHQFCHIGSYSFLGGGSVVAQDVPRYTMVSGDRAELRGLNLEGLRRNGISDQEVRSLRKAYQKVFMSSITNESSFEDRLAELEQEIELLESPAVSRMLESIRMSFDQGRRGICKFRSWSSS